jgi:predicted nuclease of restriction endonuclease-like RecB superfamily
MSDMLNLDELTEKNITFKGKVYTFQAPAASKLGVFNKINDMVGTEQDAEKVIAIFGEEVAKVIPELPKEIYADWTPEQIKAFVKYIVGESDLAKKK